MGQQITVTAMVLSATLVGDYDRRIVLLTKERGKVIAFARGARKTNSQLLGACKPFSFGQFTLFEGRTTYNIMSAAIDNYFETLQKDLDSIYYGLYFCELCDYFTSEGVEETAILQLLYQSLRAIEKKTIPLDLVRCIFEIKLLSLFGVGMQVFSCVVCGEKNDLLYVKEEEQGLFCKHCGAVHKARKIEESTVYTLQFIISSKLSSLYTFHVSDTVLHQLKAITKKNRALHIEKKLKTIDFLDN